MIKKLQRKFILITVAVLIVVFSSVVITMNLLNYNSLVSSLNHKIELVQNDFDKKDNPNIHKEDEFTTRYFKIQDNNGNITIDLSHIASVDTTYASKAYTDINNSDSGFYNNFYYKKSVSNMVTTYIFLDSTMEKNNFNTFMLISIFVSLGGLVIISSLVIIFSKIATKPILDNYQAKKEFISNINHQIKTPLAIIKASNEVIELENGQSEWTQTIDKQTDKMDDLLKKLMFISKLDEDSIKINKTDVNLSQIAIEVENSCSILAKKENKNIQTNIQENVIIKGDSLLLGELISILLDNAIKYSLENSTIDLIIYKQGKSAHIEVKNEVSNIEIGDHSYLFERYYRDQEISQHKQGYGLGLSIGKTITQIHKGKIKSESKDNHSIIFEVTL